MCPMMSFSKLARDVFEPIGRHGCGLGASRVSSAPGLSLPAWGWESSATLLAYVHKLVHSIQLPVSLGQDNHVLVITFILRNKQTNICIEFKQLQGGGKNISLNNYNRVIHVHVYTVKKIF